MDLLSRLHQNLLWFSLFRMGDTHSHSIFLLLYFLFSCFLFFFLAVHKNSYSEVLWGDSSLDLVLQHFSYAIGNGWGVYFLYFL